MKIYAKQIPPEHQESPLFQGDWPESVFVFGNRSFNDHSGRLEDIRRGLENIADSCDDMRSGCGWYAGESLEALLQDYLPREKPYTRAERLRLRDLAMEFCDFRENETLCNVLEIVTGTAWGWATIRGCCQGDWQEIIYPAEYGREWLEMFEAEYFNTGTEWIVHDGNAAPEGPEDIDGFAMYCHGWNENQIKAEIAAEMGGDPGNVILYQFNGWARSAVYAEV